MNILHTNFHSGLGGGHTTYILALLRNAGHNNYVACPPTSRLYKSLEAQGYERLIPFNFSSKLSKMAQTIREAVLMKTIIKEHAIDIVHTNGSTDNRTVLYASWLSRRKFKVVHTKHNTLPVKGLISKWRFRNFNDAVILVSDSVEAESGLKPSPKFHVVDHGIDVDYWKRQTPIVTGDKIRLVSNAGTSRNKGWVHLAEALRMLPKADRERFSMVVLGRNDPYRQSVWPEVSSQCDITYGGYLDDPRPELEKGDIGFVLSYKEASSFASREMSSMSLPVISSDFPNSKYNVTPETGWITRRGDPESIRDVLVAILDMEPEKINDMKRAARKRAVESFSLEKMISETDKVYQKVLEKT